MKVLPAMLLVLPFTWVGQTAVATDAQAQQGEQVEITEWNVPYRMDEQGTTHDGLPEGRREGTRPRDPYVDAEGQVWFCGQAGNYIAVLNPMTGAYKRYELQDGTHPHNLIIDDDGYVWYSGNRNGRIGRLDPATGESKIFMMPDPEAVRDPHTLMFDENGDVWFTAQQSNVVGKLTVSTGEIHVIPVPTERARPYGIVMDVDGERPWIVLFGTNKLATVDPKTMELAEYTLPRETIRPRRMAITSDNAVWMVDYNKGFLVRYDPRTQDFAEWPAPGGEAARPYAMTVDDDDRLWFVESPNRQSNMVGFDSKTREYFTVTPLESGGLTVRHMVFEPTSRQIWFGSDANTVGRVIVPPASRPVVP